MYVDNYMYVGVQSHGTWFVCTADRPANWRRRSGDLATRRTREKGSENYKLQRPEQHCLSFYFAVHCDPLFC